MHHSGRRTVAVACVGGGILAAALAVERVLVAAQPSSAPAQEGEYYRHVQTWAVPDTVPDSVAPAAIAFDDAGQLYVADAQRPRILVYGADETPLKELSTPYLPVALQFDSPSQRLHFVAMADQPAQCCIRWSWLGFFVGDENTGSDRPSIWETPLSIAVDPPTGHTIVADRNRIKYIDAATGTEWKSIDVNDSTGPHGRVAALSDGRIVMPESGANRLAVWDRGEHFIGVAEVGLQQILDVAAKPDDTLLVLVKPLSNDPGEPLLVHMDLTARAIAQGTTIIRRFTLGDLGAPAMPDTDWPWDLTTTADGFAFVTGQELFQVRRFDYDGTHRSTRSFGTVHEWMDEAPVGPRVQAITSSADGHLLALNGRTDTVSRFEWGGASEVVRRVPQDVIDIAATGTDDLVVTTADGMVRRLPRDTVSPTWKVACDCALGGRVTASSDAVFVTRPRARTAGAFDLQTGAPLDGLAYPDAVGLWPSDLASPFNQTVLTADLIGTSVHVWRAPGAPEFAFQAGLLAGPRRIAAVARDDGLRVAGAVLADGFVELHDASSGTLLSRWPAALGDGVRFPVSDIALGADGNVYLADSAADVIRVFEPQVGPSPTPRPTVEATATPSSRSCVVTGNKVARPSVVVLGNTASVTLTLAANCPDRARVIGADIMLVLDRSSSMTGAKFEAARDAARSFVELVDLRYHRIGLVTFSDRADLNVPFTDDAIAVIDGLGTVDAGEGGTDIQKALALADGHLATDAREDVLPVIVLLSDGQHGGALDPVALAQDARNRGVQIYTIGLGEGADEAILRGVAGSAERYFYAPVPEQLFPIYSEILRVVLSSLAAAAVIDDQMSDYVSFVAGSARPPALESPGRLRWGRSILPASGITLTYEVLPLATGLIPTNRSAVADYSDADGVRRAYEFPVPQILVVTPTPTPTRSPLLLPAVPQTRRCMAATQHADIVLVIDTSSSMEPDKIVAARDAARTFVDQLDLAHDQAAVIGFANAPSLAIGLTADRGALRRAIDGLTTSSGTRIDAALRAAGAELLTSPGRNPANKGVVVLMSDGAHNGPTGDVLAAADELRAHVSDIYTIGLGGDVDARLLQQVASPGGYYFAPDRFALADVYRAIAVRIPCG